MAPPDHIREEEPHYVSLWYTAIAVLDKNKAEYEDQEKEAAVIAATNPRCLEDSKRAS